MQLALIIVSALCVLFFLEMIDYKSHYELQASLNNLYLRKIAYLENTLKMKQTEKHNINYNKDVLDAIKVAMKVSHPDNGGKPEEFIKYKNLYNQIKKGK